MSDDTMRRLLTIRRTSDEDHAFAVAEGFVNWIEKARTDKAALRARVSLLEGLLERINDKFRYTQPCVLCNGLTSHAPDCELAKALRKE